MRIFPFLGRFHWLAFCRFRFGLNGSRFRMLGWLRRRCLVSNFVGMRRLRLSELRFRRYVTRLLMRWFSRISLMGFVACLGVGRFSRISLMSFVAGFVMGRVGRMGFRFMLNRLRLVGNLFLV